PPLDCVSLAVGAFVPWRNWRDAAWLAAGASVPFRAVLLSSIASLAASPDASCAVYRPTPVRVPCSDSMSAGPLPGASLRIHPAQGVIERMGAIRPDDRTQQRIASVQGGDLLPAGQGRARYDLRAVAGERRQPLEDRCQ